MIKNNKWKAIISSVIILLPMLAGLLLWDKLPGTMVSHWGGDGVADSTMPKALMVFGMPALLLVFQWLMLWLTDVIDKGKPQNEKVTAIIFSIIPALSLVVHGLVYSVALEKEWNVFALLPVFLGALFMLLGNYMPKTTRNRTTGIKLRWTMGNDENWNKTHRLGGKIWFWGGLLLMFTALLPVKITIAFLIVMVVVSVVVPTVYSYSIYKKHKEEGVEYEPVFDKKSDKIAIRITKIFVPLILALVAVLMFTGNIEIFYGDTDFQIVASYAEDLTISYAQVESIEYLDTFNIGSREMGFGSPVLSMGTFKNQEIGRYTLYAYTSCKACIVIRSGERVLVLTAKNAADTKILYESLKEKIG